MSSEPPATPPDRPKAKPQKLSPQHQAFCDAYRGNATQAAIDAGYSPRSAGTTGYRLLKDADVQREIDRQQRARSKAAIMSREEMQQLFSGTARDTKLSIRDRLTAAQLLGKTRGDFSEKLEVKGDLTLHELVRESLEKPAE